MRGTGRSGRQRIRHPGYFMSATSSINEELLRKLPLPLARLYRDAYSADEDQERHYLAYWLPTRFRCWVSGALSEASLRLLACVCLAEYEARKEFDAKLDARLRT